MASSYAGHLRKMVSTLPDNAQDPVEYQLPVGDELLPLNERLGETLRISYSGDIQCSHCGRRTNKSFSQGYCYPCFTKLAQCDLCIMSPEKCHYDQGTCREPSWGEEFCMTHHIVYLANSSGVKVGITRVSQVPTRWIDQGAVQALPIMRVDTRYQSGCVEHALRQHVADKTNWRTMLKGNIEGVNLSAARDDLFEKCEPDLKSLEEQFGLQALQRDLSTQSIAINYPVLEYPTKVVSHNLEKTPLVEGTLLGIKGQYLILDTGVINMRKYTAYSVNVDY